MSDRHTPNLADLIEQCLDVREMARCAERSHVSSGEVIVRGEPDLRCMLDATRLMGQLLGYLGRESNLTPTEARAELQALTKKLKRIK